MRKVTKDVNYNVKEVIIAKDNIIVLRTYPSFLLNFGERVTVIYTPERIFINSINDPDRRPWLFGNHSRNIRLIREAIAGRSYDYLAIRSHKYDR